MWILGVFYVSNCRFKERVLNLSKEDKFRTLLMGNLGLNRRLILVLIDDRLWS